MSVSRIRPTTPIERMVMMKHKMIAMLTAASLLLTSMPLLAVAEETPTEAPTDAPTDAPVIETPTDTVASYHGYFKTLRAPSEVWVGQTPDLSAWEIVPCYLVPTGGLDYREESLTQTAEYPENSGIPVTAPEYADCFTVDLSDVDFNTPGYYKVHVRTNPGKVAVFHDWSEPSYAYEITMLEYSFDHRLTVTEAPPAEAFLTLRNQSILDNEETVVSFGGTATADMTGSRITASPEGIVEIGELALPQPWLEGTVFQVPQATIKALRPGTVTLTGTTDSGLTATCTLEVRDHAHHLEGVYGYVGSTEGTYLYSEADADAVFTIADETIARIVEVGEMGALDAHYQFVRIELLAAGETTLTAVTPDGRTVTAPVTVLSSDTTPIPTGHVLREKGELTGDGIIDIMDVILLNRSILGSTTLGAEQREAADVDSDGEITTTDSLYLLKYIVRLITDFSSL